MDSAIQPSGVTATAQEVAGRFDVDPGVEHFFSEGVYAKRMTLPKGFKAYSHSHAYSHLSILSKGRARVATDDGAQVYEEGACIEIKAGVHHEIEALEDITWFCIHASAAGEIDEVLTGS
jgi:quercetin dioxygenase-like cupin family protein